MKLLSFIKVITLLVLTGLIGLNAYALGLGNLQVNSSLNEPLSAQIPIIKNNSEITLNAENIAVGLASSSAHEVSGINYSDIIQDLRFNVIEDSNGALLLNVHTRITVYEPLLSFLVSISSASGKLIKEYSVILDPGSFNTRPVSQPTSNQATARPTAAPAQQRTSAISKRRKVIIKGDSYTVQRGDSLSKIAIAASKFSGLDVGVIMQDIYDANPDAFQGSKDLLLADVTLIIPSNTPSVTNAAPAEESTTENNASTTEEASATSQQTDTATKPRLELVPPEISVATDKTEIPEETSTASIAPPEASTRKDVEEINLMKEQLALLRGQNEALESALETSHNELTQIRLDIKKLAQIQQQSSQSPPNSGNLTLDWKKWLPWLLLTLAFFLFTFLGLRIRGRNGKVISNKYAGRYADIDETKGPKKSPERYLPDSVDVPTFTEDDEHHIASIDNVPNIKDDLITSQEQSQPTIQINPTDAATQTFMGAIDDSSIEASQNLNAAQEAEIYLAYQQFKLAKKTIDRLLTDEPDNYKYKILKLQLLAKTAKMDKLQSLSVELFKQFPDRNDDVHQRVQEICDMAFTANQQSPAASPDSTMEMTHNDLTAEMNDLTIPDQKLEDTLLMNDNITEFLSEDLTLSTTEPGLTDTSDLILDESDLPYNHTDILELDHDEVTSLTNASDKNAEYDEISSEVTELLENLTEEEIELPFDLETEILQEEQRAQDGDDISDKDN